MFINFSGRCVTAPPLHRFVSRRRSSLQGSSNVDLYKHNVYTSEYINTQILVEYVYAKTRHYNCYQCTYRSSISSLKIIIYIHNMWCSSLVRFVVQLFNLYCYCYWILLYIWLQGRKWTIIIIEPFNRYTFWEKHYH